METWILLILLISGGDASIDSIEFSNEAACKSASVKVASFVLANNIDDGSEPTIKCVRKGISAPHPASL